MLVNEECINMLFNHLTAHIKPSQTTSAETVTVIFASPSSSSKLTNHTRELSLEQLLSALHFDRTLKHCLSDSSVFEEKRIDFRS